MRKLKRHRLAFTLIELLIVIALFTILASISLFKLPFLDSHRLTQEVEKLFITLRYLQQKAMVSQKTYSLTFDQQTGSYTYPGIHNKPTIHTLNKQIIFGYLNNALGPPASPTNIITKPITFKSQNQKHVVYFFPQGTISSGTVYLTDRHKRDMKAITCSIADVAFIRKYHYTTNGWKLFTC